MFQSFNSVEEPYTHSVIMAAGKPAAGNELYHVKEVPQKVKKIVKNQERFVKITRRNISMDCYYTSVQTGESNF